MNIGSVSSAQSAAQEALETLSQTKAEAVKGDLQAARKIDASQQPQVQASEAPPPQGTGRVLDAKA